MRTDKVLDHGDGGKFNEITARSVVFPASMEAIKDSVQMRARGRTQVTSTRNLILMMLLFILAGWAGAAPAESPEFVVAIGDVHGDFDDFVAILQHTGLIDKQNHWTGSKSTLVQVGDLLDRGPEPRAVMDLLMALEKEASKNGGRVVSLLGNHEMMNIMGDLRYVTPRTMPALPTLIPRSAVSPPTRTTSNGASVTPRFWPSFPSQWNSLSLSGWRGIRQVLSSSVRPSVRKGATASGCECMPRLPKSKA